VTLSPEQVQSAFETERDIGPGRREMENRATFNQQVRQIAGPELSDADRPKEASHPLHLNVAGEAVQTLKKQWPGSTPANKAALVFSGVAMSPLLVADAVLNIPDSVETIGEHLGLAAYSDTDHWGYHLTLGALGAAPLVVPALQELRGAGMAEAAANEGLGLSQSAASDSTALSILKDSVAEYRDAERVAASKNIGASIFEMDGELIGSPSVKVSGQLGEIPIIEATVQRGWLRTTDSEFQLSQEFASRYPTSISGTLHIYTERLACPSCSELPKQIEDIFPNVKVILYPGRNYQ
jgi:hypothetical protein